MTHQARYNAMTVEKYGCYCELYKCRPFCQIPKGKPKILKCERRPCFIVWGVILAGLIAMVISLCVTQIKPCGFDCGDKCIRSNQRCDGVKDCEQWKDETNCTAKFKFVPSYSVGLLGRNGRILSRAVLGDHELQWTVTNTMGEVTTLSVRKDSDALSHMYGVRRRSQSNRVDLSIWHVQREHLDYTYTIHLPSSGRTETINFIPVEGLRCTPSVAGERVTEGETVTFTATVDYYGATQPTLYWYAGGIRMDSTDSTATTDHGNFSTLTVTSTLTAQKEHNDYVFAAHLFEAFPVDSISSPPADSADSCLTRLNVLYGPYDVETNYSSRNSEGDPTVVPPGSSIKCSAKGNPAPDFSWDCEGGEYIQYGRNFQVPHGVPSSMSCTCVASNVIDGLVSTATEFVEFKTSGAAGLRGAVGVMTVLLALVLSMTNTRRW